MRPCSLHPKLDTSALALAAATLLIFGTALAACDRAPLAPAVPTAPTAPPGPAGREFRLWQDAYIFTAVRSLLAGAQVGQPLWLEMYEFGRPDLVDGLVAAQARGADVRVIVDRTVPASARTADRLAARGLAVRAYPVDDSRHQIDHVKLLISGPAALVGGMNWGSHSWANHDYVLETARADVLLRLRQIFEQDWALSGGHPQPLAPSAGSVAQTAPGEEVRGLLLTAIGQARRTVSAEVFVLTDPDVLMALAAAHRNGVRVRLILDPAQDPNLPSYRLLRAGGLEVRWYPVPPGSKLHAKAALFDGRQLLVGSANWSLGGLSVNHELDLLVDDQLAAQAFTDRFERDWAVSG
jgi:phosphatidylserine/phosphatidylglycerophosphate/cardiolipin synthase-like enzyme